MYISSFGSFDPFPRPGTINQVFWTTLRSHMKFSTTSLQIVRV